MSFPVHLTRDAVRDLEDIYDYIDRRSSSARARYVLVLIEKVFRSLSAHPQGGNFPAELLDIGIQEYRQVFFKPSSSRTGGVTCRRCCNSVCCGYDCTFGERFSARRSADEPGASI